MDASVFICPACRDPFLVFDPSNAVCTACAKKFPISSGISLLVVDPQAHEQDMAETIARNPAWYSEEQPREEDSPWRHHMRKRREYVSSIMKRELQARGKDRAQRLLDLGCGDGTHLQWLKDHAVEIFGSDYNLLRLSRAKKFLPEANLFLADILNYPAKDGVFDLVFFNHVIEHIPQDEEALAAVRRMLAPGGILVLGTPNEGSWWWQLAYKRAPEILKTTDHVHFYTATSLRKKVEAAGLRVVEIEHMGWGPPDWRLDGLWRKYKWVDDAFELFGRAIIPKQASSLYIVATK
jgi:SAM-dependent methyltransferase